MIPKSENDARITLKAYSSQPHWQDSGSSQPNSNYTSIEEANDRIGPSLKYHLTVNYSDIATYKSKNGISDAIYECVIYDLSSAEKNAVANITGSVSSVKYRRLTYSESITIVAECVGRDIANKVLEIINL